MIRKSILLLIILLSTCGCSKKKDFIKHLEENYAFNCYGSTAHCSYEYEDEKKGNGTKQNIYLSHDFIFNNNIFSVGYTETIWKNNEILSEYISSSSFNYKTNAIASKEGTMTHYYTYNYKKDELVETNGMGMYNKKNYDCKSTTDKIIIEKCKRLKDDCLNAKGMFYKYLTPFEVDDIIEE